MDSKGAGFTYRKAGSLGYDLHCPIEAHIPAMVLICGIHHINHIYSYHIAKKTYLQSPGYNKVPAQVPLMTIQIPANRNRKALERGAFGVMGLALAELLSVMPKSGDLGDDGVYVHWVSLVQGALLSAPTLIYSLVALQQGSSLIPI